MTESKDIIKELEKKLNSYSLDVKTENIGVVQKNGDGVVVASGLSKAVMGEQVYFEKGNSGVILGLDDDSCSIILLDRGENIKEGDIIKRTGKLLSIQASEDLMGRVVNPLGIPLDGLPKIKKGVAMPLERIAAGVVEREPVNTPLKTGIKAIDSMVPIGRGQRELIIGDRGLGKTAIAIDTIINQKSQNLPREAGKSPPPRSRQKPVICIYVAIGQKQSSVAQIVSTLKDENALHYSVVVAANAHDPASLQYLAPYAGMAIAEYFLQKGEDVLIIHDDLTKHAWAYRQISLILGRPAGREAYPGDIFYLHSRLLERSVKLNKEHGGGSITALPIIETQANDISAYIPTNVISITDGQIYLQPELFNIGIRPAINVGNSVSRVGGAAQTAAMKSVAGKLRLELAQYRELAAFAQFGSELDPSTLSQLERGKRLAEILKQQQYNPLPEAFEILSIWSVINGYLDDIPVEKVLKFEEEYHDFVKKRYSELIQTLSSGEKLSDPTISHLKKATIQFKNIFKV